MTQEDMKDLERVVTDLLGTMNGPPAGLDFGQALAAMKAGKRVRRASWLVWQIAYYLGSGQTLMSETALSPANRYDEIAAILAADILASDWSIVP